VAIIDSTNQLAKIFLCSILSKLSTLSYFVEKFTAFTILQDKINLILASHNLKNCQVEEQAQLE
jgi:hypothetical protein